MKTARSTPAPALSPHHQYRPNKSSTPLTSPRMLAYSVGQPYPPNLPPAATNFAAQDVNSLSSPSYFGLVVESTNDPRDSAVVPRENWSSPSSSVKSYSTAIPKQMMPLDANPTYEAFRRGADANHLVRSFSLGTQFGPIKTPPATAAANVDANPSTTVSTSAPRPQLTRRSTQDSGPTSHPVTIPPPGASSAMPLFRPTFQQRSSHEASKRVGAQMEVDGDADSMHDSAYMSSDSKRNSEASIDPRPIFNAPRFESPVQLEAALELKPPPDAHRQPPPHFPLTMGRLSMSAARKGSMGVGPTPLRAETAPPTGEAAHGMMDVQQLKEILELDAVSSPTGDSNKRLLLLDVRVATYYATSRIHGALNMCIPTTLLKRATFTLQKMQLTFAKDEDQASFAAWRDAAYLVVYDNNSAEKRDAVAAMNMLRKFTNEGFKGQAFVLRGGFAAFEEAYPNWVDRDTPASPPSGRSALSLDSSGPRKLSIAPILGGVMLPGVTSNTNPFFSNIRQNMDLADGVGRIELTLPPGTAIQALPAWLRTAADPADHGQRVSQKFLDIEVAEQARMKDAYGVIQQSMNGANRCAPQVQISGVEKGVKNRYKDILPFDHSRVRLQGRAAGECDYVNASHLRASRSNKRYIATQAPLPATFSDFWSMIWDEDVRVIVMLTAETEGGQVKCHPYWKNSEYGQLTLRLLSEKKVSLEVDKHRPNATASNSDVPLAESGRRRAQTLISAESNDGGAGSSGSFFGQANAASSNEAPFVHVRKFALSHRGHAFSPMREVTQLHYPSWPDFGTPAKPSHLLALVELANANQHAVSSPVDIPQGMTKSTSMSAVQAAAGGRVSGMNKIDSLLSPWHDGPETNPAPRPMLVHCSAGCGRTGAFCTVDSVIDMLKRQHQRSIRRATAASGLFSQQHHPDRRESNTEPNEVIGDDIVMSDDEGDYHDFGSLNTPVRDADKGFDPVWLDSDQVDLVAGTVEDFRSQRLSMVQSLRQYVLCYETIAEWVTKTQERRGAGIRGLGRARSESLRMTLS
ncbi:protein-tyrosine phosphatase [Sporothrix schenckii 1099-18]|uniref:protein-tyrosine-phosphatase n=1 Tax=Sporothrix schenckii 1099-18 TaxID=1397361 RepID=A0A0F2M4A8_SPOSC|nr:protein-tyrosine phosphatase [Sporothrix schenckii 1099-18]KJR84452.1 protein-tyrosine phosphatase [Sporothrix schenckii 1099-18]